MRLERNWSNVEIYAFSLREFVLDLFGLHFAIGVEMVQL
jgi:hypothetical protein